MNSETKNTGSGHKTVAFLIPFSQIGISKWNRSCDIQMDDGYIGELAEDIKRNGLLHPVTLVKTADGSGYRIVAGANRVAALRKLRGDDSGLTQTEFRLRDDLIEDDQRCLDVSLAENHHRRASSVYETALYVDRLIHQQNVNQGKLARMLGFDRPKVNRLLKLTECYAGLPDSWKHDLNVSPTATPGTGFIMTFGHWYEVAGQLKDRGVSPEVAKLLEMAHDESWSTRQLREELRKPADAETQADKSSQAAEKPAAAPKVKGGALVRMLLSAVESLRKVAERLQKDNAADAADLIQHAVAVDAVRTRLEAATAAKKAEADALKAQKKAEATAKKAKRKADADARKIERAKKKAEAAAKKTAKRAAAAAKKEQKKAAAAAKKAAKENGKSDAKAA